jgi:2-haloalkanoic acid dehalogenase type II
MGPRPHERGSQARAGPPLINPWPRAVLFDLLTALLDSWTLWDRIAGSPQAGRAWRAEYLRITYGQGRYQPYETLVREAAIAVGLPARLADDLAAGYCDLRPWPETPEILQALSERVRLGVVTNCSEALGHAAVACTGAVFSCVVTAERAGWYKPCPEPYRLALQELGVEPSECLFVAGSAYDLVGAARVGMPVFWHDRIGMAKPAEAPPPRWHHASLEPLRDIVLA